MPSGSKIAGNVKPEKIQKALKKKVPEAGLGSVKELVSENGKVIGVAVLVVVAVIAVFLVSVSLPGAQQVSESDLERASSQERTI